MSIHTAAQERHISNLQIVSQDGTHVTASWDIVDGYHNSGNIQGFFGIIRADSQAHLGQSTFFTIQQLRMLPPSGIPQKGSLS